MLLAVELLELAELIERASTTHELRLLKFVVLDSLEAIGHGTVYVAAVERDATTRALVNLAAEQGKVNRALKEFISGIVKALRIHHVVFLHRFEGQVAKGSLEHAQRHLLSEHFTDMGCPANILRASRAFHAVEVYPL